MTRTNGGMVTGNLEKQFTAPNQSFTYPVGTLNGYSPVSANLTAVGTNPSSLTVKAVQGAEPNASPQNTALQRYWTLTETGDLTANLVFNYLDADVPVGTSESTLTLDQYEGSFNQWPAAIDTNANTVTTTAPVSQFSDWTLLPSGNPLPGITSDVNPNTGLVVGGTSVTITGTHFTGATAVSFGGTDATNFTVDSDSQITATSPSHDVGTVDVRVTTPAGASPVVVMDHFTYFQPAPTVTTVAATNVGPTFATLNGSINPNGTPAIGFFNYGSTNPSFCNGNFGTRTADQNFSAGNSTIPFSQMVTNLQPSTKYYFCAEGVAGTNAANTTLMTFTTSAQSSVAFGSSNYNIDEGGGHIDVNVIRTGDTSGTSTVNYTTFDETPGAGHATQASDYEIASGTLTFGPGETSKTFTVLIVDDKVLEGNETLGLSLSNVSNIALGSPSTAELTIIDNDTSTSTTNPYDDARFFVRQHYLDFLNREPDQSGWDFWTGVITQCGNDAACTEVHRINVSAAYFLSKEFQNTGYVAYVTHRAAFGPTAARQPRTGAVPNLYARRAGTR